MRLEDALFDNQSTGIIVPGRMSISPEIPGHEIQQHDHLLINLNFELGSPSASFRAISRFHRIESGFCEVEETSSRLAYLKCLTQENWLDFPVGKSERALVFEDGENGMTSQRIEKAPRPQRDSTITKVVSSQSLTAVGLQFRIVATLVPFRSQYELGYDIAPQQEGACVIEGTIPWATLVMRRMAIGGQWRKFAPREKPSPPIVASESPSVPTKISDLLWGAGPARIYTEGNLSLIRSSGRILTYEADLIDLTAWGSRIFDNQLNVSGTKHAVRNPGGFCSSSSGPASFNFSCIRFPFIEALLRKKDEATYRVEGDGLGWLNWYVGLGTENAEMRSYVRQDLASLVLRVAFDAGRLTIAFSGTFKPFDKESQSTFRPEDWAQMTPWEEFDGKIVLQSLWLRVVGSELAKRCPA